MLTVLLVDDDYMVVNELKSMIDWGRHGFTIVGEARNGVEALRIFRELKPNIVISDIRMPEMDGIDLARAILETEKSTRIILLSAYEDFNYARQALNIGVVQYLLKHTLEPGSLSKCLCDLQWEFQKEYDREYEFRKVLSENSVNVRKIKERIFWDMVFQRVDTGMFKEYLRNYSFNINFGCYCILLFKLDRAGGKIPQNVSADFEKFSEAGLRRVQFELFGYTDLFALAASPENTVSSSACGSLQNELAACVRKYSGPGAFIGISSFKHAADAIHSAFLEAMKALYYCSMPGNRAAKPVVYEERLFAADDAPANFMEALKAAVLNGDETKIGETLEAALHSAVCGATGLESLQDTVYMLDLLIDELSKTYGYRADRCIGLHRKHNSLPGEIYEHYSAVYSELSRNTAEIVKAGTSKLVKEAVLYLNSRYSEDISLQSVADELSISRAYLSKIFKKETGVNFIDYISKVRINKAIELLKKTNLKIYEIAEKVGFKNAAYMSYCFKEHLGVSPMDFRNVKTGLM